MHVLVQDSGRKAEEDLTSPQTQARISRQCHFSLSTEIPVINTDPHLSGNPTFPREMKYLDCGAWQHTLMKGLPLGSYTSA